MMSVEGFLSSTDEFVPQVPNNVTPLEDLQSQLAAEGELSGAAQGAPRLVFSKQLAGAAEGVPVLHLVQCACLFRVGSPLQIRS